MYIFAFIIMGITGILSLIHIIFGIREYGDGMNWLLKISELLFFASLLFIVARSSGKKGK